MRITDKFNYRCALEILESKYPDQLNEILNVLNNIDFDLIENEKGNNNFSRQIQEIFTSMSDGWEIEVPCESATELRYDLINGRVPVEIEIGHQRVVNVVTTEMKKE